MDQKDTSKPIERHKQIQSPQPLDLDKPDEYKNQLELPKPAIFSQKFIHQNSIVPILPSPKPQPPRSQPKPKQKLPITDQELQKNQQKYPIALFLGSAGVGKTSIITTIFSGYISNLKEFQLYPARIEDSLIYNFVDTKAFDFESNIDEREQQIKLYQSIFYKYPNKVGQLFVVVNFERTDLMKKKLLSIYKFFRKFSSIISIIVTDIQLSDNQEQSEKDLKKNFQYFKAQNIIFVRRDTQGDELLSKLKNSLNKIQDDYEFDLTDTIFEKEDEEETKRLQDQLMQRFK
ncbi:unnamed protein product [Paramecium sonneborni]|uniref:Uncharacterized protein n=1 Tax=Paramecium sonneborni TaxID=65129 RepID=A0A8S1RJN0_9CILI|nr:unnamed protein product [Paramecium sonneborni]